MSAKIRAVLFCDECGARFERAHVSTVGGIRRAAAAAGWSLRWGADRRRADWCYDCTERFRVMRRAEPYAGVAALFNADLHTTCPGWAPREDHNVIVVNGVAFLTGLGGGDGA